MAAAVRNEKRQEDGAKSSHQQFRVCLRALGGFGSVRHMKQGSENPALDLHATVCIYIYTCIYIYIYMQLYVYIYTCMEAYLHT